MQRLLLVSVLAIAGTLTACVPTWRAPRPPCSDGEEATVGLDLVAIAREVATDSTWADLRREAGLRYPPDDVALVRDRAVCAALLSSYEDLSKRRWPYRAINVVRAGRHYFARPFGSGVPTYYLFDANYRLVTVFTAQ
jgi:hypothetical protein